MNNVLSKFNEVCYTNKTEEMVKKGKIILTKSHPKDLSKELLGRFGGPVVTTFFVLNGKTMFRINTTDGFHAVNHYSVANEELTSDECKAVHNALVKRDQEYVDEFNNKYEGE
jgi:polyhydroxyalkanoate synthesis regulator phasin